MRRFLVVVFLLVRGFVCFAQTDFVPDMQHRMLSEKAYKLILQKKYKEATLTYDTLFMRSNDRGVIGDNYNAACAWAMSGDMEKGFHYLRNAVFVNKWTNISLIMQDPDLSLLRTDRPRWVEIIGQVLKNGEGKK
jgi:hypothetical protein